MGKEFEVGKTYEYESSCGAFPYLKDGDDQVYIGKACVLVSKNGNRCKFEKELVEPKSGSKCVCVSTDPLVLECEEIENKWHDNATREVEKTFRIVGNALAGRPLSNAEVHIVSEICRPWPMEKVPTAAEATELILENIQTGFEPYYGNPTSKYSVDAETRLLLHIFCEEPDLLCTLMNSDFANEVEFSAGNDKIVTTVKGMPVEQFKNTLMNMDYSLETDDIEYGI